VSGEHALVRDELVLTLVTNPHHCVRWREGILQTGVAGVCGAAAEPRSVQTVHRRYRWIYFILHFPVFIPARVLERLGFFASALMLAAAGHVFPAPSSLRKIKGARLIGIYYDRTDTDRLSLKSA